MEQRDDLQSLRDRLSGLNTKAYYLLVALAFAYSRKENPTGSLKWAVTLTALVAVLPVQDLIDWLADNPKLWLEIVRWSKVVLMAVALTFTLVWVWSTRA